MNTLMRSPAPDCCSEPHARVWSPWPETGPHSDTTHSDPDGPLEETILNPGERLRPRAELEIQAENQCLQAIRFNSADRCLQCFDSHVVSATWCMWQAITGTVFALDARTGEELWTHTFHSVILPGKGGYQGTFLCPNGITATPVIDRSTSILYVIAPDGALYGLDLGGGNVRYGPVQFVAPFSKNWSLNLVDGTIYTVLTQGCGGGTLRILFRRCSRSAPPADPAIAAIQHRYRGHLGAGRSHHRKKRADLWLDR